MRRLIQLGVAYRIGGLGQNAFYGTAGLGIRTIIQAGYLILLSRWMGGQGYGLFAGSVAAVMLVAPLSGWGINYILSRGVAHNRNESRPLWATALTQVLVTGTLLMIAVVLITGLVMHERVSVFSMLLLAVAELILPIAQAATSLCFALNRGFPAGLATCLVPAGRLLMALTFLTTGAAGVPELVAWSHFLGTLLGIVGSIALIAIIDGLPDWQRRWRLRSTLVRGSPYAVGGMVSISYREVDKVLMLEQLGAAIVGPYTAAFRVASVFALPVSALMSAALPRLFASCGDINGKRTLRAVAWAALAYGLIAMLIVAAISPWMPLIFGDDFAATSQYLLLLAPWPVLFALHQSAATGLTAFDHQRTRVAIESVGLLVTVVLNIVLLPRLGAKGAVLALLVAEAFMAAACWLLLNLRKQSEPPSQNRQSAVQAAEITRP